MTKDELKRFSFSEIENMIDEAIQEGHIKFLSQLAEEDNNSSNETQKKEHVVC